MDNFVIGYYTQVNPKDAMFSEINFIPAAVQTVWDKNLVKAEIAVNPKSKQRVLVRYADGRILSTWESNIIRVIY